jgi:hypothetical protein
LKTYPVQSSNISAIGYDPVTKVMRVTFQGSGAFAVGSTYEYTSVAPQLAAEVLFAESVGKAFNSIIKPHFTGRKIEDQAVPQP